MKKIATFIIVACLVLAQGGSAMADYNIQISQRNANNTEWDNLYPITKTENVKTSKGNLTIDLAENTQEHADIKTTLASKTDKTYVDGQLGNKRDKTTQIGLVDLAQEVKEAMTGGSVAVVGENAVGTQNIIDKSVTSTKTSFPVGTCQDSLSDLKIARNGSNLIVNLYSTNATYKISFWFVDINGSQNKTVKIDSLTASFTIPAWNSLIWNFDTNLIEVAPSTHTENCIILLTNTTGLAMEGYLKDRFYEKFINNLYGEYKIDVNLSNSNSLYIYHKDNAIYVKFDGSINFFTSLRASSFTKTYNDIINDIIDVNSGYFVRNSPEKVKNCILLPQNYHLKFNLSTDRFEIGTSTVDPLVISIFENTGTRFRSRFFEGVYSSNKFIDLKLEQNYIPESYNSFISSKENTIINLQNDNTFCFAFYTDMHYEEQTGKTPARTATVLNSVNQKINFDAILNGGDNIMDGDLQKSVGLEALKYHNSKLTDRSKLLNAIGNHDFNYSYQNGTKQRKSYFISPMELYNLLHNNYYNDIVYGSKENLYYYKDFSDKKVRVIVLNTNDIPIVWVNDDGNEDYLKYNPGQLLGIRQAQLEWLANTALNFSNVPDRNEWCVIVLSHCPLVTMPNDDTFAYNRDIVQGILESFVAGSTYTGNNTSGLYDGIFDANIASDYTSQGSMKIAGCFCGHGHRDRLVTLNGITYVQTMAGDSYDYDGVTRTPLTYSEIAFDAVTIDKQSRTVNLTRFGAGTDRQYAY